MAFSVVIPARYSSTRLPGKPLLDIAGKPMVQRVYEQARKSNADRVIVATDDQRIFDAVINFGGEACMTRDSHPSGTDRLQEVTQILNCAADDILVNVQGDEPLIPPQVIDQVAWNLEENAAADVATLCEPIKSDIDFNNPNVVKVVVNQEGMALYFSRSPIPFPRDAGREQVGYMSDIYVPQRHIGIYAYRCQALTGFVSWPPAPMEQLECLEQLRFLWNGSAIHVARAMARVPGGVDSAEDLQRVIAQIAG